MISCKRLLPFALLFIFSGSSFAEQIKMAPTAQPYLPWQATASEQPYQQPIPQLPSPQQSIQQPSISQQVLSQPATRERLSDFERYLAGKIEITETQLEVLKKHGLSFSYTLPPSFGENVSVPVKIIKDPGKEDKYTSPIEVDAGLLVGTSDAIDKAFRSLGIKGPFAVSTDIRQFGYDLFRHPPSSFAPVDYVPVGIDYVVGPGDEIKLTVWGKVDGKWSIFVDRDGNISLPKVGILGVSGLTFRELKELLQKEFSKYYTGFEMNVSMGALRTIRVYIVGNAEKPGAYTVSSLSTLVTALFEAGGPSKVGTMRDIQLKRSGKTIAHFDIYDFLLKGDKTNDIRLMPEDVIFIPPVGMLAAIAGSVHNPAIYELKGETEITQLIGMAGGLNDIAFKGRVQIVRIADNVQSTVFESNLDDIRDKELTLKSGDIVKIYQVVEDKRTVKLSGAVQREGEYGFQAGMTVKDLILMGGGLKYYASAQAELARVKVSQAGPQAERLDIDLSKAMDGDPRHNLKLEMNDYLLVRAVPEWQLYKTVTVSGEVRFPGKYTLKKGETVSSLIERVGGITDKGFLPGAIFTRESVRELQQRNLDESIDRLEKEMLSQSAILAQTAFSPEDAIQQKAVAEQQKAIISKMRAARAQGRMVIKLEPFDKFKGSTYDIELEDRDSLFIPEQPNSIQVIGSVYNSTAFIYDPNATISSFIEKAGGTTRYADDNDIFVLKVDGSAVARRQSGMFFMSSRLTPGDTIVVPEKVERIAWMRDIKDFTQILYQIAVAAAVVIKIF